MCQCCTARSTSAYRVQTLCFPHICHPSACGCTLLPSSRPTSTIPAGLDRLDKPLAGMRGILLSRTRLRPLPLTLINRLPIEIMEHILDDASHDIQTLHACSLVCTAWRSYLIHSPYEQIVLHSGPQLHILVCAARNHPTVRDRLAPVRSIILQQHGERGLGFAHVFPLMLSPYLHQVERLSFDNCTLQPLHKSFFSMLRQLKHVKRLQLSTSSLRNFADFRRVVCAFPQLEELDIEELRRSSSKPSQVTPPHLLNLPCMPRPTGVG